MISLIYFILGGLIMGLISKFIIENIFKGEEDPHSIGMWIKLILVLVVTLTLYIGGLLLLAS